LEEVPPEIARNEDNVATLSGSPLTEGAIEGVPEAKTTKLAETIESLIELTAHSALAQLPASLSFPRLVYFLRCSTC